MSALTDLFTNIANAIRAKTGSQETIVASDFPTEIANIPSGGVGGDLDWEAIGYNGIPDGLADYLKGGYDYAKEIKDNWNPAATSIRYPSNKKLRFFPNDLDTSNLKVVSGNNGAFSDSNLFIVPVLNTSKVTDFRIMFQNCGNLIDASNFASYDLSNGTKFSEMFAHCGLLKKVVFPTSQINTTSQIIEQIFRGCSSLEEVDFSKASFSNINGNFSYLFSDCEKLKKVTFGLNFNTSGITNMSGMFLNCLSLEDVDFENLDTSNVTTMQRMFYGSSYNYNKPSTIGNIDISSFNTSSLTDISEMFGYYSGEILTLGNNFDCSKVTKVNPFGTNGQTKVKIINGNFKNLGQAYTAQTTHYGEYGLLLHGSDINHDSLVSIIDGLYDLNLSYNVAGGGTLYRQRLQLGAINYNKLTAAEIQVATDKGWDVT